MSSWLIELLNLKATIGDVGVTIEQAITVGVIAFGAVYIFNFFKDKFYSKR